MNIEIFRMHTFIFKLLPKINYRMRTIWIYKIRNS